MRARFRIAALAIACPDPNSPIKGMPPRNVIIRNVAPRKTSPSPARRHPQSPEGNLPSLLQVRLYRQEPREPFTSRRLGAPPAYPGLPSYWHAIHGGPNRVAINCPAERTRIGNTVDKGQIPFPALFLTVSRDADLESAVE